MFGVPLLELMPNPLDDLPYVITMSIKAIEERGLNEEGIYRIPGTKSDVDALKIYFNSGRPNLDDDKWADVNIVGSTLKQFLREMPGIIFCFCIA